MVVGKGAWVGRGKKKGHKETFGVMDILSVMMLSWVYKHLRLFKLYILNMWSLSYVSDASVKLLISLGQGSGV